MQLDIAAADFAGVEVELKDEVELLEGLVRQPGEPKCAAGPAALAQPNSSSTLTRGQRRTFLRIDARWPWRQAPAANFARLQALPELLT